MPQDVYQYTFANGLTLLAEPMPHVRSAALNFLIPAGYVYDRLDRLGAGTVMSDLITRGAGDRDSRELTLAMDNLGLDSSESVGSIHMRFWGATVARNLPAALEIYADVLLRPHLPEDELDAVRSLALQDIRGLEDEPRSKVLVELRSATTPRRSATTTAARSKAFPPSPLRTSASGISVCSGRAAPSWRWPATSSGRRCAIRSNASSAPGRATPRRRRPSARAARSAATSPRRLAQTQIAAAYASVPVGDPDYYAAMGAVHVLSGGMSARLFTEVREKRALCYSVWASYQTFKDRASVISYAGTTNERAQETLDVLLRELRRLPEGIEMEEVERVQAGLKSSLIMQQESTSARAWRWPPTGTTSAASAASTRSSRPSTASPRRTSSPTSAAARRPTSPSSRWGRRRWKQTLLTAKTPRRQ